MMHILDTITRRGSFRQTSSVLGFSDETLDAGIYSIEVVAEVDLCCSLPDNFGLSEIKYGRVKDRYHSPAYRSQRPRWEAQFNKTRIYIADPSQLGLVGTHEENFSRLFLKLHPLAWLNLFPIQQGGVTYGSRNVGGLKAFVESELVAATNRKGSSLVNVRRRVLKAQALFRDILEYQPYVFRDGEYIFDWPQLYPQGRHIALPLTASITYDEGHESDIDNLHRSLVLARGLIQPLRHRFLLPDPQPILVSEMRSSESELIQLADFCAGYAKELYKDSLGQETLPRLFREVYVNGRLMI